MHLTTVRDEKVYVNVQTNDKHPSTGATHPYLMGTIKNGKGWRPERKKIKWLQNVGYS